MRRALADRVEQLRQAARARHDATLARATQALQAMVREAQPITFRRVANSARVSRSWLYRQPQLRDEIERLRQSPTMPGRSLSLPSGPLQTPSASRSTATATRSPGCRPRTARSGPARPPARRDTGGIGHQALLTFVEDMSSTARPIVTSNDAIRGLENTPYADIGIIRTMRRKGREDGETPRQDLRLLPEQAQRRAIPRRAELSADRPEKHDRDPLELRTRLWTGTAWLPTVAVPGTR